MNFTPFYFTPDTTLRTLLSGLYSALKLYLRIFLPFRLGIQIRDLSVTGPTLLTARLPATLSYIQPDFVEDALGMDVRVCLGKPCLTGGGEGHGLPVVPASR